MFRYTAPILLTAVTIWLLFIAIDNFNAASLLANSGEILGLAALGAIPAPPDTEAS